MSVGHINQWVSNIYEVHKAGRLNLGILSSLSYAQIAILGFKDDEEFKMLMESTDPLLQKDSFAVKILAENKNATQSLNEDSRALKQYIAHTMIVPSKMESDPDTVKKFTAQCNFILKDRLLRQAEKNRDTAFKFMIDSWERISMHDIEAYNNGLPPETRLDVSSDAFQNELSKLDSRYFTQIANGESIDPAAKGWEPCGEHLQQAGDAKRKSSQEAILSDFFFHHAPGIKH